MVLIAVLIVYSVMFFFPSLSQFPSLPLPLIWFIAVTRTPGSHCDIHSVPIPRLASGRSGALSWLRLTASPMLHPTATCLRCGLYKGCVLFAQSSACVSVGAFVLPHCTLGLVVYRALGFLRMRLGVHTSASCW